MPDDRHSAEPIAIVGVGCRFPDGVQTVDQFWRLLAEGRDFESLPLAEWRGYSELFDADVIDRVTTRASVEARRTPQSTHPGAVQAALKDLGDWLRGEESRKQEIGSGK